MTQNGALFADDLQTEKTTTGYLPVLLYAVWVSFLISIYRSLSHKPN